MWGTEINSCVCRLLLVEIDMEEVIIMIDTAEEEGINLIKIKITINNLDMELRVDMTILSNNNNTINIMHNMVMVKTNMAKLDKIHQMVCVISL